MPAERTTLCAPGLGLSCAACCPPIRPPGYDHADHAGPLRRLLTDNTQRFRAGWMPSQPMVGGWCPGLGWLGPGRVGCLYHPMQNAGRDLRHAAGYQPKCARESCAEARAWATLPDGARAALLEPCRGLDTLRFGSRRANPVMRLLGFGPEAAALAAALGPGLEELRAWPWLWEQEPALGWLAARLAEGRATALAEPGFAARLSATVQALAQATGPAPPHEGGRPLADLADEWEARLWRALTGRRRATGAELARWRAAAEALSPDA